MNMKQGNTFHFGDKLITWKYSAMRLKTHWLTNTLLVFCACFCLFCLQNQVSWPGIRIHVLLLVKRSQLIFEVLTAIVGASPVLLSSNPYIIVTLADFFLRSYMLHAGFLLGWISTVKMEVIRSSETSVHMPNSRRYIKENGNFQDKPSLYVIIFQNSHAQWLF
jgi:hypothetical protein